MGLLNATPEQMTAVERVLNLAPGAGGTEPEPLGDDAARKLFALVSALESGSARMAPVLTVFRLYCIEGLSAEQTARKCRCSKTTVIKRLNSIRRKTGTSADMLRAYSPQFERMEEEMSDSRAKKIYRQAEFEEGHE
jgi:DNA-directed RNA polymerase specialized sigma24 family protein